MQHRPQLFYTTAPAPCPYLPDRTERKVLTELSGPDARALHNRLSQAGFRRSHTIAYAPVCVGCRACTPMRLPVRIFAPTRTQRKILNRHSGLQIEMIPPVPSDEQFRLFEMYQATRHADSDMANMCWRDYVELVANTPVETFLVEFRTADGTLVCVSLVDRLEDGLSAVYTFYNVEDAAASWGTFSILWLIQQTAAMGLEHLYLGYYVPGSPKMAYKAAFGPAQIFRDGHWTILAPKTTTD